ncbi:MAG: patatin-like phospholipase family protein [Prevotella sp.]|jgi:NTE family protein
MNILSWMRGLFRPEESSREVALVLSGGGARGLAEIGAVEELEQRGYKIRSVAGTSMGAMVGGFYAAGKLDVMKERVLSLNWRKVWSLIDLSIGLDHLASGNNLSRLLEELLGDANIEQLPVDFCCVASDLVSGKERVFSSGPLCRAILASISIPGVFRPVLDGEGTYVDGSVHNIFPLDRVARHPHDLLVGVNVSAPDKNPCTDYIHHDDVSTTRFLAYLRQHLSVLRHGMSENYVNLLLRVARISLQNMTQTALRLNPPDIYVEIPMDSFGLFDYGKANEIMAFGKEQMARQLDSWEESHGKRKRE